jgi:hypothetical protein
LHKLEVGQSNIDVLKWWKSEESSKKVADVHIMKQSIDRINIIQKKLLTEEL